MYKLFFSILLIVILTGCGSIMPYQGPSAEAIINSKNSLKKFHYTVISLKKNNIKLINQNNEALLHEYFRSLNKNIDGNILGLGDTLGINLWENSSDGLFSGDDHKQTNLKIVINEEGKSYIPHIGYIQTSGKKIKDIQYLIEKALSSKTINPQVQVHLINNNNNVATLIGDIGKPGNYVIPVGGIKLAKIIALAGGLKYPSFDVKTTITRNNISSTIRLSNVMASGNSDISIAPRDVIQMTYSPRSFTAFGAVAKKNQVFFHANELSLVEALAKIGGLQDAFANANGVFVFRFEDCALLKKLKVNSTKQINNQKVAIIYHLNLNNPYAFFLAKTFKMQDKDIIYVANAPIVEFNKFLNSTVNPIIKFRKDIRNS